MLRLRHSMLPFGTFVLALGVVTLAWPRAAHAIAATLVQVTNTTASPAITQSTNTQASQLVSLYASSAAGDAIGNSFAFGPIGFLGQEYTVPPSQSLVITDIDIEPNCSETFQLQLAPSTGGGIDQNLVYLFLQGPVIPHISYRSGVVFPGGTIPVMQVFGCQQAAIYMHGYLTSN
jgi:hypothetical protein